MKSRAFQVAVAQKYLLQAEDKHLYQKETPTQAFSCVYCEIFKYTFSAEHIRATVLPLTELFCLEHSIPYNNKATSGAEDVGLRPFPFLKKCYQPRDKCFETLSALKYSGQT